MIKLKNMINEGKTERKILDSLTSIVKSICDSLDINLIGAKSNKDEWGIYVWDFFLSNPLPEEAIDFLKNKLRKNNPTVSQATVKEGTVKLRILVG